MIIKEVGCEEYKLEIDIGNFDFPEIWFTRVMGDFFFYVLNLFFYRRVLFDDLETEICFKKLIFVKTKKICFLYFYFKKYIFQK